MNKTQIEAILREEFDVESYAGELITDDHGFVIFSGDKVDHLYIKPESRGQGRGRLFMEQVRERVGGPLRLQCHKSLVPYYEAIGFEVFFTVEDGEFFAMGQDPEQNPFKTG